jgi:hypothetical protein
MADDRFVSLPGRPAGVADGPAERRRGVSTADERAASLPGHAAGVAHGHEEHVVTTDGRFTLRSGERAAHGSEGRGGGVTLAGDRSGTPAAPGSVS